MTFLSFLNTAVLTFGPFYVTDRSSSLAGRAVGSYFLAFAGYIATQVIVMIAAATFLPLAEEGSVSAIHESIRAVLGIADAFGVGWVLTKVKLGQKQRVLAVGVGWAMADAIFSKLLPLWMTSRELEFSWLGVQLAIESNLRLAGSIALAALVFSTNGGKVMRTPTTVGIVLLCVGSQLARIVQHQLGQGLWFALALEAGFTAAAAGIAYSTREARLLLHDD